MSRPQALIAEVARRYLYVRETSKNQGPGIAQFWTATSYRTGYANREPYCAAFGCFCVWKANDESPFLDFRMLPNSAAVKDWVPWAKRKGTGCQVFTPADIRAGRMRPMAGDIAIMLPKLSHLGIVAEDWGGGHAEVELVEANTSPRKVREGGGVYGLERPVDYAGHYIRLPAVAIR